MTEWHDGRIVRLQSALEEITGQVTSDGFRSICQEFVSDCAHKLAAVTCMPVMKLSVRQILDQVKAAQQEHEQGRMTDEELEINISLNFDWFLEKVESMGAHELFHDLTGIWPPG